MDYRSIIESKYNRANWQSLLHDIFRQYIQFWQQPQQVNVNENMAKCALYMGKINLPDAKTIAVYEVELSDTVVIERNRAGIRNLLCSNWKSMGCVGAFMFCYRESESVLRFSYVSESFSFSEDGSLKKDSTDTKRFTYLLGEGHRSRTAIEQFEKLKSSGLTLQDITKAFSVEALSKRFFDDYKKQYEDIVEFVTGKRMVKVANKWEEHVTGKPCNEILKQFMQFQNAEKAVRDYVKKLMGRLVFIQFLQKKGWMGCSASNNLWNDGDREFVQNLFANTSYKNTFVDDVLEPLFNDINTKRDGDIANPVLGKNIKVPYLNGGLFENDEYDKKSFPLPAKYMKSMLDFFSSYNFTIDENDPDDAEIGVDPEMLGRIFENLLEDNKDKGAFYTPKEIVQYMCRESLIAYLQTDIEDETVKDSIREFVLTNNASILSDELAVNIDEKLKVVKICDPAIGSGAFPMGLLRELYACRKAIEGIDNNNAVKIKTHIIQNNIYGVDIEKGAVDIARLRFWLALIVDETTPHALPNMDFKIMQGNSLLEQYEGVNLSGMSLNEQEKQRASKKKQTAWLPSLAFDEQDSLSNIQRAINEYYGVDDHDKKEYLRNVINENIKSYILNIKGCTPEIKRKLENLPIPNDQFFLWHIYFKEVFDKGGFDIVIGNPPYVDSETMTKNMPLQRELYTSKFKSARGNWDLFIVFIEHGINILKNGGIFCNIVPNKLIAAKYAVELRKIISSKCVLEVRDYSRVDIFENASVYPITILLRNDSFVNTTVFSIMANRTDIKQSNEADSSSLNSIDYWDVFFVDAPLFNIMSKINKHKKLAEYDVEVLGAATVADAYEIKKFVSDNDRIRGFKLVNSGTIDPYQPLWGVKLCRYIKDSYFTPIVKSSLLSAYSKVRYNQAVSVKIIVASMTTRYEAILDYKGEFIPGKSTTIIIGDIATLRSLIGIINSKLASFWLNIQFNSLKMSGGAINVGRNELLLLPIAELSLSVSELVLKILELKNDDLYADTSLWESRIDKIVYHLYDLTYDEILIIDPETSITREEYEQC